MAKEALELYIHIPFCAKKCAYCDFLSFDNAYGPYGRKYFQMLEEELQYYGAQYGKNSQWEITSIFIGGGTPSLPDAAKIAGVLDAVYNNFTVTDNAEITIEANPGTVTAEKFRVYRNSGINRLSLGVQSLNDGILTFLGRIHRKRDFLQAYELAREAGFTNINTDLILGVPGDSPAQYRAGLQELLTLRPEHISAYSLIVEEGTPLYEMVNTGAVEAPEDAADREMYYMTSDLLGAAGYQQYEISNFAMPGFACRHNVGYWTGIPYLGVGLGAASYLQGVRFKNTTDIEQYIKSGQPCKIDPSETDILTEEDRMNEFMMLGFRLLQGPDPLRFYELFGTYYTDRYADKLADLERQGLLERRQKGGFGLTKKGLDYGNLVFGEFI